MAVMDWLAGLHVDYGLAGDGEDTANQLFTVPKSNVSIVRVFASPDRAFAATLDTLRRNSWISASDASALAARNDMSVLPLPVATVSRGDPLPDAEHRGVPKFVKGAASDPRTGVPYVYQHPTPYRTDYTVNFWCRKRYTEAHIREWVYSQFGTLGCADNERMLDVQHINDLGGRWKQAFRLENSSDMSDLEGATPRYIRFDYTFSLRTWMVRSPIV
jgi:hypothetical protein